MYIHIYIYIYTYVYMYIEDCYNLMGNRFLTKSFKGRRCRFVTAHLPWDLPRSMIPNSSAVEDFKVFFLGGDPNAGKSMPHF